MAKKAAKKKAAKKKAVKKRSAKPAKKAARRGSRTYHGQGEVFLRNGAPLCRVPLAVQKLLGTEDEIPIHVTIGEVSFYALLRTVQAESPLFQLDTTAKPLFCEFFLYRTVREVVELRDGMQIDITLKKKKHRRERRGKLIL